MLIPLSISLRNRIWLSLVAGVACATLVLTAGFNALFAAETSADIDRELVERTHQALRLIRDSSTNARFGDERAFRQLAMTWIYASPSGSAVYRPGLQRSAQTAADALARSSRTSQTVGDEWLRLRRTTRTIDGRRVIVVTGLMLAPYQRFREIVLRDSLLLMMLVTGAAALIGRRTMDTALTPVREMTRTVSAWSTTSSIERFGVTAPTDELTELAWTFDRLLDKVVAGMRHERLFAAEVSHELRTPIAALIAESELALRRERTSDEYRTALTSIHRCARVLADTVETLTALSSKPSAAFAATCDPLTVISSTLTSITAQLGHDVPKISVRNHGVLPPLGVDALVTERILTPVLINSCRYGATSTSIDVTYRNSAIEISVRDNGRGITPEEIESIFEPGYRGTAASTSGGTPGSGLGLPLARRVSRIVDGDVFSIHEEQGAHIVIRLPSG